MRRWPRFRSRARRLAGAGRARDQGPRRRLVWPTAEGIAVKPLYTAADLERSRRIGGLPGLPPYLRGPRATMYAARPWTIRQYAGFSTADRIQRVLPAQPRRRPDRPLGRLRSRHPSRLRQRPSARRGRRRQGGRRDRQRRGHEDPVRGHPARPGQRLDDDERRGAAGDGVLHHRRRGAGRRARSARRHDPERHPQGVHGPQHLHLPARALDADRRRRDRLRGRAHAALQPDLDLRLPHAGGGRDLRPGARLHARRRPRIRPRGDRARPRDRRTSRRGCRSSSASA